MKTIKEKVTHEEKYSQLLIDIASHQLKSSLSTANWYIEMMLEKDTGQLNPEQREFLKEIQNAHERMTELVNILLNMSKIELGTFQIVKEAVDLKSVVSKLAGIAKPQVVEKKIDFVLKLPQGALMVESDSKVINIVLENLISNAVKYTPMEGRVILEITTDEQNMLIKVQDTGFGIPKAEQDKIFTRFFRAGNAQAKASGNGLGLYIVKTLLDKISGKVWFESEENKGTTFFVQIPIDGKLESKA